MRVALIASLLMSTSAMAQAIDAEALALEAAAVHAEHCSDAAGDDVVAASSSVAAVSPVWARVAEAYEDTPIPYLLYWRAMLGECLNQDDKALADYRAFVAGGGEAAQIDDARRRIRRLDPASARRSDPGVPGYVAAGALWGAAGGSAALAIGEWQRSQRIAQQLYDGEHWAGDPTEFEARGESAQAVSRVGVGGAIGFGVGGAVALAIGLSRANQGPWRLSVVPTVEAGPGGVAVGIGGRW